MRLIPNAEEFAPAALVNLAEGARAFSDWTQAERNAEMALEIARQRKDVEPERVALEVLKNVFLCETLPPEIEPEHRQRIENLIRRFTVRLRPGRLRASVSPEPISERLQSRA